jgi:hypothetical protein
MVARTFVIPRFIAEFFKALSGKNGTDATDEYRRALAEHVMTVTRGKREL